MLLHDLAATDADIKSDVYDGNVLDKWSAIVAVLLAKVMKQTIFIVATIKVAIIEAVPNSLIRMNVWSGIRRQS